MNECPRCKAKPTMFKFNVYFGAMSREQAAEVMARVEALVRHDSATGATCGPLELQLGQTEPL